MTPKAMAAARKTARRPCRRIFLYAMRTMVHTRAHSCIAWTGSVLRAMDTGYKLDATPMASTMTSDEDDGAQRRHGRSTLPAEQHFEKGVGRLDARQFKISSTNKTRGDADERRKCPRSSPSPRR